jgi:hypothetical protein
MIIQRCLGWHLLLEAPLLLPQAMEMDRDRDSISILSVSPIVLFVLPHMRNFSMLNFWFAPFWFGPFWLGLCLLENRSQPVILLFSSGF